MSTYVVEVSLRHKDSNRTFATWVEVQAPYDRPQDAELVAAQFATTHRPEFMPIRTRIVEMEA